MSYQFWQLKRDADGIAWATLDCPGQAANTLGAAVMDELGRVLDELDAAPPRGLIFRSGKAAGFIAGADIGEFSGLDSAAKGRALVARPRGRCCQVQDSRNPRVPCRPNPSNSRV